MARESERESPVNLEGSLANERRGRGGGGGLS